MNIIHDADLSELLWYKIGGRTKYLLEVSTKEDILEALQFIQTNSIKKIFVCGLGANLLFSDEYFDGVVIRFISPKEMQIKIIDGSTIEVFAGQLLDDVIQYGFNHDLTGLEWAGGLPGTVGAAVRGNVGAFGGEIKDVVGKVTAVSFSDNEPKLEEFSNEQLAFSYRSSIIKTKKNMIVVSAQFHLQNSSREQLEKAKQEYVAHISYRKENHPNNFPNSGSVFKNIAKKEQVEAIITVYPDIKEMVEGKWYGKVSMGYLNNRLGFSGFQIGGAKVSEQHANFIDNVGNAKAKDVISIIESIQGKFKETFGFIPEPEVEIVR